MKVSEIRPYYKLAILCFVIFGALGLGSLEGISKYLEDCVWKRHDPSQLKAFKPVLGYLKDHRLVPRVYKSRFAGLLGDADYYSGRYADAAEQYFESINLLTEDSLLGFVENQRECRFSLGYREYMEKDPGQQELDESLLMLKPLPYSEEDNDIELFLSIPAFDEKRKTDVEALFGRLFDPERSTSPQDVSKLVADIEKLYQSSDIIEVVAKGKTLGEYIRLESGDLDTPVQFCSLWQLLMIDSWLHFEKGNQREAAESFDSAYRVLGYFYQNPSVFSAILICGNRGKALDYFESNAGAELGTLFEPKHRVPEDFLNRCFQAEYWMCKNFISQAEEYPTPMEVRFKQKAEKAIWKHFQELLAVTPGNAYKVSKRQFNQDLAGLINRHRSKLYRVQTQTKKDGVEFAEFVIDVRVVGVMGVVRMNFGRIWESAEELVEREKALLTNHKK